MSSRTLRELLAPGYCLYCIAYVCIASLRIGEGITGGLSPSGLPPWIGYRYIIFPAQFNKPHTYIFRATLYAIIVPNRIQSVVPGPESPPPRYTCCIRIFFLEVTWPGVVSSRSTPTIMAYFASMSSA